MILQLKAMLTQIETWECMLSRASNPSEAPPPEELFASPQSNLELSLKQSREQLLVRVTRLKAEVLELSDCLSSRNADGLLTHKAQKISDHFEALARTLLLQQQTTPAKTRRKRYQKASYQPNLNEPWAEKKKLEGYESQLEQQLTQLIDKRASTYQVDTARERLQKCRDALSLVNSHLRTFNQ